VVTNPAMLIMGTVASVPIIALLYLAIAVCYNVTTSTVQPVMITVFPAEVRYSGSSLGWNLGAILGGGRSPIVAGLLVSGTGSPSAPALFVFAAAAMGLAILPTVRSPRTTPLSAVPRPATVEA
jgi:MHS family proline/betaine transporter-like MFS transporter